MAEAPGEILKRSFPPVVDARTRLLILGSLPGEQSLKAQQYYANPRNHFWRLAGAVIERELEPLPYVERLDTLLDAGVGLWDTVASANRAGSLDAAIRQHEANDLARLATALPQLCAIAFNGRKSAAIGRSMLGGSTLALVNLPSSSPAFTRSFEHKLAEWIALRRFLG